MSLAVGDSDKWFIVLTAGQSFRKRAAVEEAASDELAPAVLKITVLRAKDLLVSEMPL